MTGNSYNGYSWQERMAKFDAMKLELTSDKLAHPVGPCALCGDPGGPNTNVTFEYHDEDYSLDYRWYEPASYVLCRDCHIYRLHQRFAHPRAWAVFLAHVRRGGYARELKDPAVKKEVAWYRAALEREEPFVLCSLRPPRLTPGAEWFARLSLDPASKTDPKSRPRS